MALVIVRGPAGGGKSQYVERERRPGEVLADFTAIYAAMSGATRGPDGKYPIRTDDDPLIPLAAWVKAAIVRQAAARQLNGYVTTSSGAPGEIERLRELGASDAEPVTLDPGEATIRARWPMPKRASYTRNAPRRLRGGMGRPVLDGTGPTRPG